MKCLHSVLLGLGILSLPMPFHAQPHTVTVAITGTVASGTDVTGIFLLGGGNLAGKTFILVYMFDDRKGDDPTPPACKSARSISQMIGFAGRAPGVATLQIGNSKPYKFETSSDPRVNSSLERKLEGCCFEIALGAMFVDPDHLDFVRGEVRDTVEKLTSRSKCASDWNSGFPELQLNRDAGTFNFMIASPRSGARAVGTLIPEKISEEGPSVTKCGPSSLLPSPPAAEHICSDPDLPFFYDTQNPNFHSYNYETKICDKQQSPHCTVDEVFQILVRTPAAIGPVTASVQPANIFSCATVQLRSCPKNNNRITVIIDPTRHSLTNYTQPGHIFYPGQIMRDIVERKGEIFIVTTGIGVGCFKQENEDGGKCKIWPDADYALQQAVWQQFNLGEPPPRPGLASSCNVLLSTTMWTCDKLTQ